LSTNIPIPSYVWLKTVVFSLTNKMPSSKFIKKQWRKTNRSHICLFLHIYVSYLPLGKSLLVDNSFLQHTTHTTDLCFFPNGKYETYIWRNRYMCGQLVFRHCFFMNFELGVLFLTKKQWFWVVHIKE
jgi:hypothetical protein